MTNEEVLKSNELIAKFMGGQLLPTSNIHPNNPYNKPTWWGVGKRKGAGHFGLQYHSDWNWLMEVVNKIIQMDGVDVKSINWYVEIFYWGEMIANSDYSLKQRNTTMIKSYYQVVVDFIEWYNENQPKKQ